MRLIFTILLIGLFKAEAQVVINASAPSRPVGGNLLLDQYAGAVAAYSIRKIRFGYSGAAIRVRKDTTGQPEQDIGFVNNELDTSALKTFAGNNSAFVTIWYDQSTNSRNATQTTQANQPRIVNGGTIDRQNGKPCIIYDGTNDHFNTSTVADWNFLHQSGNYTNFMVARAGNVTDPEAIYIFWGTTNTLTRRGAYFAHDTRSSAARDRVLVHIIANGSSAICSHVQNAGSTAANTQFLIYLFADPTNATLANRSYFATNANALSNLNGTSGSVSVGDANHSLRLGTAANAAGTNGLFLLGSQQEVIFYSSNQSANRTAISNNINSFYSIY